MGHWARDPRYISAAVFLGLEVLWCLTFLGSFLWFVIAPVAVENYNALVILAFHAGAPVAVLHALERLREGKHIAIAHAIWIGFTIVTDAWSIGDSFRYQTQGTLATKLLNGLSIVSIFLSVYALIWYLVVWWRQAPRVHKPKDHLTPPPVPPRDEEEGLADSESVAAPLLFGSRSGGGASKRITHQTPRPF